ncbi:MAG: phosphatidylserine/phosphatidylglycerophosphate/cardiolipin synthase family protein [Thiobacillaceae bacterium]|jgi:cardiolipin synthase|nr:phosphatidylserine/phosphatidylglycerophosphate/cardiolipin synthase family protein [Thiobacillaceae bacterium]
MIGKSVANLKQAQSSHSRAHTRRTVAAGESLGDDARMFAPLGRLKRFWILPLALLAIFLTSCASQPGTPPSAGLDALPDLPPDGAWYRDGQLVLSYSHDEGKAYLSAVWPVDDLRPDRHNYRMAMMDLSTDSPADPTVIERDWQPIVLYDSARWEGLVEALLLQLAPSTPTSGVLVTVQGVDLVLYRDDDGRLHTVRIEDRPATLRIGQRISEEVFSARANEHLMAELTRSGEAVGPALFAVGDDELGGAFVLFDFERRQSVFISRPPAPRPPGRQLGFTLQMIDALTLQSHVLSALRHPVTLVNRLFWLGTHSLIVMLPHGSYAGENEPPPLAGEEGMDLLEWEQRLDELVGSDRYRGSMKPLVDGDAFFLELVKSIQEAQESIDIRVYIFDSDDYALRIADLLKRRSHEIRVRVLVDRFGTLVASQVSPRSPGTPRSETPLSIAEYLRRDSKIEVRVVDNPWLTSDHTKVIVVDRRKAFVGGMNIGREYRNQWHDLMVEVAGPIVGRLHKDFDKRWAHTGIGGDLAFAIASMGRESYAGDAELADYLDIRPLYTRSGDPQILRAQLAAIRQAKSRIWIEQPYVSEDMVISELIRARRRGVDVRIIMPARGNSGFMNSANLVAARAFLNNGIRVYAYPGMSHVKAALYDGWAIVGSANFDKLSLRINQETNLATSDPGFVHRIEQQLFEVDFARAREWTEKKPADWSDYLAKFFADQL